MAHKLSLLGILIRTDCPELAKLAETSNRVFQELAETSAKISVGSYNSLKCRNPKDAIAIFGNPKSSKWDGIHFVGAGAQMFSADICALIKSSGCLVKVIQYYART